MDEKNYRSSTGVSGFTYGVVNEKTNKATETESVKFLQNISIDMPQEIVKAYGDNRVAEMSTSSGEITVTSQFHKLPMEDKVRLLGMEKVGELTAYGNDDVSPYVGVIFNKTFEDGSKEYVGLPLGIFTRPGLEAGTKEGSTEFTSEEIEAEFMDRKVEGFSVEKSVIFASDVKGENTNRDALHMVIFGIAHDEAGV